MDTKLVPPSTEGQKRRVSGVSRRRDNADSIQSFNRSSAQAALSGKKRELKYSDFGKLFGGRLLESEIAGVVYSVDGKSVRSESRALTQTEIDRANRLARIVELSERVFGDAEKSSRWLKKPRAKLSGQTPLALIATDAGAAVVEEMLHRIDHGMFA
jgi:hypothetical protein